MSNGWYDDKKPGLDNVLAFWVLVAIVAGLVALIGVLF